MVVWIRAVSNGLQEKKITLKIAKQIETIIFDNYSNVSVKCSRTGDETVSLLERVNLANRWGADLFCRSMNAGGGTGFESYVYPKVSDQTKQYQVTIHDEIMKEVKWHNRGWKKANFMC